MNRSNIQKAFALLVAAIAWFAVILQWIITTGSTANFLSYFTIQCNLLVAISLSFAMFAPRSGIGRFFSKLPVQSAIALYIFIVGLVYNLILRGIWEPQGWQLLVDNLLHVAVPLLYVLYWLFFRAAGNLQWRDGLYWILFPTAYLFYSLIRGSFTQWYPYPFLNAAQHGYSKVAVNVCIMVGAFLVSGIVLIAITRFGKVKETAA